KDLVWIEDTKTLADFPPLNRPRIIAIDYNDGTLYTVAYGDNGSVLKYDQKTSTATRPFGQFARCVHINQKTQNVYMGTGSGTILRFAPDGAGETVVAGGNGQGTNLEQFQYPSGLTMVQYDNLYISDHTVHRITKWAPNATLSELVGGVDGAGNDSTH
ncbi:unnamed protein product, partial [Didymodactylos carnosus]